MRYSPLYLIMQYVHMGLSVNVCFPDSKCSCIKPSNTVNVYITFVDAVVLMSSL